MKQPKYDSSKPCSWCNPCPASFCDCGMCNNKLCQICFTPSSEYVNIIEDEKKDKGENKKA